jgi:hypothetical protein
VFGGGVQVGGLGDPPYFYDSPVLVNALFPDGVAQNPFMLTTWLPVAPGAMAGVAGNVFATGAGYPLGAVWDSSQVAGGGRLVVLMDINWLQPEWADPFTVPQVAQNLELFLSNLSEPPGQARPFAAPPRVRVAPATGAGTTASTP